MSYFLPVVGFEPEPLGLLYVGNSPRSGSILKYRHFTSHKVAGFCHRKFAAKRPKLLTCFCVSMIFSLSSLECIFWNDGHYRNRNIPSSHQTRNYYQLSPLSIEQNLYSCDLSLKVWQRDIYHFYATIIWNKYFRKLEFMSDKAKIIVILIEQKLLKINDDLFQFV